jgi:hypothetical protein
VRFESTIPESARPQTYALDRTATGIGGDILPRLTGLFLVSKHRLRHIVTLKVCPITR